MSSSSSSKQVRTDTVPPPTLSTLLFRKGDFSVEVVRTLTELLTFNGTVSLVSISKEIYNAKIILFQAPKEWINNDEVRMMFSAMLGTTESQWKRRIDTSLVETLTLGVNAWNERPKTHIVIDTWFRSLENKFPNLQSLNLAWCSNITDASLSEVARGCSTLHTLDLTDCSNITDASISEVARRCSNLQSLNLTQCENITDTSVIEVARQCSNLHTLNLSCYGSNITDASLSEVARRCSNLQSLNLEYCSNITDASISEVARRCSNLHTLDLWGCNDITSTCKDALQQAHPQLQLFNWN